MNDRPILALKHRIPYPVETGGDAVSFALLLILQRAFPVTVVAVDDGDRAAKGAEHLRGLGMTVVVVQRDRSVATRSTAAGSIVRNTRLLFMGTPRTLQSQGCRHLETTLDSLTKERRFALTQFENWPMGRFRRFVHGPAALLNHDAWFRTAEAFARYERSPVTKMFRWLEARATRRYEKAIQSEFEWSLFMSEEDRREISAGRELPCSAVLPVPFPFEPQDPAALEAERSAQRVLFVGAMNAEFNIDAVCYFVDAIWPAVRQAVPEAQFLITGREPDQRVLELAATPGVTVAGWVPDLDDVFRRGAVFVAPMRIGTGVKVKVAHAMSWGLPIIGSTRAFRGLPEVPGLIGVDHPGEFARRTVELLLAPARRIELGQSVLRAYRERLWLETVRPKVIALYERMMMDRPECPAQND